MLNGLANELKCRSSFGELFLVGDGINLDKHAWRG
jgi:hypothetical protein